MADGGSECAAWPITLSMAWADSPIQETEEEADHVQGEDAEVAADGDVKARGAVCIPVVGGVWLHHSIGWKSQS